MFLPDINVWLALAFESHMHHQPAREWFDHLEADTCTFCRLTQMGFLRLATNPKAMGCAAVSMNQAWSLYDAFQSDERITTVAEPTELDSEWRNLTHGHDFSPKLWNDTYLAAFSISANLTLVSFDQAIRHHPRLSSIILS